MSINFSQPLGVALVTGGARRLGRAIALGLARDGWDIAVHYGRSAAEAGQVVEAVRAQGRRSAAFAADLDDGHAGPGLVDEVSRTLGEVRCLVNNASIFQYDDIETFSVASLEANLRVNLAAPMLLARALWHRALREPAGAQADPVPGRPRVVINLLDQKLDNPNPDYLSYTLSKAALKEATTLCAMALAPRVRVVGISPGITLPSGGQSEEEFALAHRHTPLGRSSTPEDIAQAVAYAARADALTGTTLIVDGGQHLFRSERDVMFKIP